MRGNEDRPSLVFRRLMRASPLGKPENLWPVYRQWRKMREHEIIAKFHDAMLNEREKARAALLAWPNPLENAKKGVPYRAEFTVPVEAVKYRFMGLEKIGLAAEYGGDDSRRCVISGVPGEAGEFEITLCYAWTGFGRNMKPEIRKLSLIVNPNPREMWRDLPCDLSLEYLRPNEEAARLECAAGLMAAASRRGRSHAHEALPRDDAFALACHAGWQILAVSDGAGSASFSRRGAELACALGISACKDFIGAGAELDNLFNCIGQDTPDAQWLPAARKLAYGIIAQSAFAAHKGINQEASRAGREPRAYAATFLLAMAKRYERGWAVMSFQIGDGAICMFNDSDAMLLGEEDAGEYGGQTRFLTMPDIFEPNELMRRLQARFTPDLDGLLLFTDGVTDPLFGSEQKMADARLWLNLWHELEPLAKAPDYDERLLQWLNFWERGHHDDRTLAMFMAEK